MRNHWSSPTVHDHLFHALINIPPSPPIHVPTLLPHLNSLSRLAVHLAKQSNKLGLHEHTARLLDLSGDDSRLIPYLKDRVKQEENDLVSTSAESAAAEQLRALQKSEQALFVSEGDGDEGQGEEERGVFRRGTLLAGVTRLPQV